MSGNETVVISDAYNLQLNVSGNSEVYVSSAEMLPFCQIVWGLRWKLPVLTLQMVDS